MTSPLKTHSSILQYVQLILFTAVVLYFGKTLFIPLFFGLLIAIVMYPICNRLEKNRWPRSLAITACLLIVAILFAALVALLIWQVNVFVHDAPVILKKLELLFQQMEQWAVKNFGFTINSQNNQLQQLPSNVDEILKNTVNTTFSTLFLIFLTPVYTALFLFHRRVFVQYLQSITGKDHQFQLHHILQQTIHTYFNYIKGMIMVYLIVGVLNSIGLLALGIEHAILFGMLCAIMTIIPYVGIVVSALLPVSVAWITTNSIWYPIGVIAVFAFVQYLEANIIFPKVISKQLNVSTWATLVAIISGGILWGVAGMILFIPFVAVLKIITDNIPEWRSLNTLLSRE